MLRRITGSGFTIAMIILIALRIPAFAFCECKEDLVLNKESCCSELPEAQVPECGCCPLEETLPESWPCSDCIVILSIDPGHYTWSADEFQTKTTAGSPPAVRAGLQDQLSPPSVAIPAGSIRGSPPPCALPDFLLGQVLRL